MRIIKGLSVLVVLAASYNSLAQTEAGHVREPCYTRHWVDSANQAIANQLESGMPILANWYAYDGQQKACPAPSLLVNIIWIRIEEECPVEEADR